jgi:nicotinamidase-related amidase
MRGCRETILNTSRDTQIKKEVRMKATRYAVGILIGLLLCVLPVCAESLCETALIVIDMQTDLLTLHDGIELLTKEGYPGLPLVGFPIVDVIAHILEVIHATEIPVIYTKYVTDPTFAAQTSNGADGEAAGEGEIAEEPSYPPLISNPYFRRVFGPEMPPEIAPREEDLVLVRSEGSPMNDEFKEALTERGITQLMVCGVYTTGYVDRFIRDACLEGFDVIALSAAHADFAAIIHNEQRWSGWPGATVIKFDDLDLDLLCD